MQSVVEILRAND